MDFNNKKESLTSMDSGCYLIPFQKVDLRVYPLDRAITALCDDHWRHIRNLLTPGFSGSKLRRVSTPPPPPSPQPPPHENERLHTMGHSLQYQT